MESGGVRLNMSEGIPWRKTRVLEIASLSGNLKLIQGKSKNAKEMEIKSYWMTGRCILLHFVHHKTRTFILHAKQTTFLYF
jgi:hypothetical protein